MTVFGGKKSLARRPQDWSEIISRPSDRQPPIDATSKGQEKSALKPRHRSPMTIPTNVRHVRKERRLRGNRDDAFFRPDNSKSDLLCYSRRKHFRQDDSPVWLVEELSSSTAEGSVLDEQTREVEARTRSSVESTILIQRDGPAPNQCMRNFKQ